MKCCKCECDIPEDQWDNDTDTATCPRCGALHSRMQFEYRTRLRDFLLSKAGPRVEIALWENGKRRLRTALRENPLQKWGFWILLSVLLFISYILYGRSLFLSALFLVLPVLLAATALASCFERLEVIIDGENGRWRCKRLWPRKWKTFRCAPDTRFIPLWRPVSVFSDNAFLVHVEARNKGSDAAKRKLPCGGAHKEFGIVIMAFLEYSRLAGLDEREAVEHSEGCGNCLWLSGTVPVVPYGFWHISFRFIFNLLICLLAQFAAPYIDGDRRIMDNSRIEIISSFFSDGQKCLATIDSPPREIGISYRLHKDWVREQISVLLKLKGRLTQAVRSGDKIAEAEIRNELKRLRDELTETWAGGKNFPRKLVAELACRMAVYNPLREAKQHDELDELSRSAEDAFRRFDCQCHDHRVKEVDFLARLSAASNTVELMRAIHNLDEGDQTNRLIQIAKNWSVLVDITAANPHDRLLLMISANVDPSVLPMKWNGRSHVKFEFSRLASVDSSAFGDSADAVTFYPSTSRSYRMYTKVRCGEYTLDKLDSIFGGKSYKFSENAYFLTPVGKVRPRQ